MAPFTKHSNKWQLKSFLSSCEGSCKRPSQLADFDNGAIFMVSKLI